jgi:small subunit ribosomal protein S9
MTTAKEPTTKTVAPKKPRAPRKAVVAHKPAAEKPVAHRKATHAAEAPAEQAVAAAEHKHVPAGRYIFATGRRKTSVANVRLFSGKGDSVVNKKPLKQYFNYSMYQEEIGKPFDLTGLGGDYYFTCHVNGGGPHSQATAVQLGIAIALGKISEEVRKVLKKNGLLTRDDRKKERKKPGLKRARRSPQWAKR